MAGNIESPLLIRNENGFSPSDEDQYDVPSNRIHSNGDSIYDVNNGFGSNHQILEGQGTPYHAITRRHKQYKTWELNYQEAAIYLQEGENNDKYSTHPRDFNALPAYKIAHKKIFYALDLFAALLVMGLAACERPAVPFLTLPVGVHGSLELFGLLILALELGIRMKWLGFRTFIKHKRTLIKSCTLIIVFIETIVVIIRQHNHFRVTRSLRPLFLIDTYYCRGVRRTFRQILQSMPPIIDMLLLLLFFMLIFSILGFYLFSGIHGDAYFATLQDSFISLFVLLTTANYPDVMMPAYASSRYYSIFYIIYLSLELYFIMNLFLAVVYDTFSNLEKTKVKKLFFHKRLGCQHAFRLLVTKEDNKSIKLKHFLGMMKHLRPKKSRRDGYLVFKMLNMGTSGALTLEEFHKIYEAIDLQWMLKSDENIIWSSHFKYPFNRIFRCIHSFVKWKWFKRFIYFAIASNFLIILVETIQISVTIEADRHKITDRENWASVASTVYVCIYIVEAILKILGKGPAVYFTSGWDLFDFVVTGTSVIGLLGEFFDDSFYFIIVLRPFKLLRLFKVKERYRDVLGTLFVLFTRLISLAIVIILVYYFFAIIGMEMFLHTNLRNCCKNTSVEAYYKYSNDSTNQMYYYLNNFDNILESGVTLFELTVVNNWFIIMEGYAHHIGEWSRVYFMLFYIVMMVVMNIVVAFILEQFLFRMQYNRKMEVKDIEDLKMSSKSVLEHFTVPDDFQNGNTFKGKCMHCGTLISGSYKVTSNFVTHMKLGIFYHSLLSKVKNFKNLMEKADTKYQVPSRKHLSSKLLHEKSVEIKNNLVNTLKRAESVCLTIDLWSSRQMRAKLAVQYLAIPATSAPVERLFSTAGKTFRPERCRLADGTFEKLMMVKCNGKMLK
ncbi:two pore calcium channel protein 1 [Mytilus galloprovincialis]|uniref:Two pore calcium channel protein 1 n=1 Tax=Mytilus galloprovincialis TaxID=29158 RepID=A0A8B6FZB8_MYTGA|nr:two pore calcium channel protein 1 [Mytilus galloprovincialis]